VVKVTRVIVDIDGKSMTDIEMSRTCQQKSSGYGNTSWRSAMGLKEEVVRVTRF
jgi:hypothetical protein